MFILLIPHSLQRRPVHLEDINLELIQTMKTQAGEYADILETIFQGIMEAIHEADDLKVYTSGMTNMLKYPELMDSATAEKLLGTFEDIEDKEDFVKYVEEVINKDNSDIEIRIGDENSSEDLKDCSLVTATYIRCRYKGAIFRYLTGIVSHRIRISISELSLLITSSTYF